MEFVLLIVNVILIAAAIMCIFVLNVSGLALGIWVFTLVLSVFNLLRLLMA